MRMRFVRIALWFVCIVVLAIGCARGVSSPQPTETLDASTPSTPRHAHGFERIPDGAFVGFDLSSRFSATIDERGATISGLDDALRDTRRGAKWTMSLRVARVGRERAMRVVGASKPTVNDDRIEVARGLGVTEWFAQHAGGLEHGMDLTTRPAGEGDLVIEVAVEGRTPIDGGGRRIELREEGKETLVYDGLSVKDARGREVAASMVVVGSAIEIRVRDEGARYPIVVDPVIGVQQAKLGASDGASGDEFGNAVDISGTIAVVGAWSNSVGAHAHQGAAYVFVQSGTTWTQQAKLVSSDGASYDEFGYSVAISGTTVVVGAPNNTTKGYALPEGGAYVFKQSGTTWTQQAKLVASDPAPSDVFGRSVAISGGTAIVGAYNKKIGASTSQGAAYVFVQSGTTWAEQAKLVASDGAANHQFGQSAAIDGATAVVGAIQYSPAPPPSAATGSGAAYIFVQSGTTWAQQARLSASDAILADAFGYSVRLNATTAVVGAPFKTVGSNANQGAAYLFVQSGTSWTQQAKLVASDGIDHDQFGFSVALSGVTAIIGTPQNVGAFTNKGAAYVFGLSGTTWTQQVRLGASDAAFTDNFGFNVALDGSTAIVGAPLKTIGTSSTQGAAYAFVPGNLNGNPCTVPTDCISGFCAEGVCCDGACGSACQSCLASRKGSGTDGTCGNVASGGAEPKCPPACNSSGAGPQVCNGAGACTLMTPTSCALYICNAAATACLTTCSGDPDCVSTAYCTGGACAAKKSNGAACTAVNQCTSGNCVEGVCCDTACGALCYSCLASRKGGSDGTCGAIGDGGAEPKCPAAMCSAAGAGPGVCNGIGGCRSSATTSCSLYVCNAAATACLTTCTGDGDCIKTAFCSAGTCIAKAASTCTKPDECISGFCVDGFCCDKACDTTCEACAMASTGKPDGTCGFVKDGLDPHGNCPGGSCSGGTLTNNVCNGAGACRANTLSCAPYVCDASGTACSKKCAADTDCDALDYCASDKTCTPKKKRGQTCTATDQCSSSNCVDGVCCDRPCNLPCEACDEPGSEGTCITVKGQPRTGHTACKGAGSKCGGSCDASDPSSCSYPKSTTTCGAGCSGNEITGCDGSGGCGAATACPNFLTCASADACRSSCSLDTDCVAGYRCNAGACIPSGGNKCSSDGGSSLSPSGTTAPCAPYRCDGSNGLCFTVCASDADCAAGNQCASSQKCVPITSGDTNSSGGCDVGGSSAPAGAVLSLGIVAMLGLVRRRRRV